jgi:hypothetical protein
LADQFLVLALGWAIWSLGLFEALAFILLFFSWFCIHELGYYHNEYNSSEENPRHLNPHVKKYKAYKMLPEALIWSGSSAALALWLLPASYLKPGLWLVFLGLHALVFRWHNGLAPHKRYFSFLSLHSLRYFWPWIFFSLSPAGAALIVAQILRYLLLYYRQKSGRNAVNKYFSDHFWMLCLYLFFIWVLELLIPNTEFIKESIWFIGLTSLFLLLRALYQQYAIYQSKARES